MTAGRTPALVGLATVAALAAVFAISIGLFRGSFTESVPVTVISQRAGLVMNPDAKVQMRGVEVGKVDRIDYRPDGTVALTLAMDPDQMRPHPVQRRCRHRIDHGVRRQIRQHVRPRRPVERSPS